MKKRKKKNIKTNDIEKKIRKILDKRYFHVCISYNERSIGNVEWEIYYSNLPSKVYFSNKNKSLLSSNKNTISDIYELKSRFEKEKQLVINKNIKEYLKLSYEIFSKMLKIQDEFNEMITDLLLINVFCVFLNALFFKCIEFSILNLVSTILIAVLGAVKNLKINKKINKFKNDIEEDYIQEKLKQQGLFFVERLRQ